MTHTSQINPNFKIRFHEYKYENVVIGNSLEAILYAHYNDFFLIPNIEEPLLFLEFIKPRLARKLGFEKSELWVLETVSGPKDFGYPSIDLWKRLLLNLALQGLSYPSDMIYSIRLDSDENSIKIQTKNAKHSKIFFKNLYIFNENLISGLPAPKKENRSMFKVVDWMHVRVGQKHKFDYHETIEQFVNKVFFYPCERTDHALLDYKDACSVSYLSKENLFDFEYSDTYARFAVENIMESLGIKGRKRIRSSGDPTDVYHKKIKVESAERDIYPLKRDVYEDFGSVKFIYSSLNKIIKERTELGKENNIFGRDSTSCRPKIRF